MLVVLYFGCEWLPVFFIITMHRKDFLSANAKKNGYGEKSRVMPVCDEQIDNSLTQSIMTLNQTNSFISEGKSDEA